MSEVVEFFRKKKRVNDYNNSIIELSQKSQYLPVRYCDQKAVVWLAQKDLNSETLNFHRVLNEARQIHKAHPKATLRVDRFWTLSEKSHDIWVTTQRLLIAYDCKLADCINPKHSVADDDWDNIIEFACELFPASFALLPMSWREIKQMRKEYIEAAEGVRKSSC